MKALFGLLQRGKKRKKEQGDEEERVTHNKTDEPEPQNNESKKEEEEHQEEGREMPKDKGIVNAFATPLVFAYGEVEVASSGDFSLLSDEIILHILSCLDKDVTRLRLCMVRTLLPLIL